MNSPFHPFRFPNHPAPATRPFTGFAQGRALLLAVLAMALHGIGLAQEVATAPHPVSNPTSPLMLAGDWVPTDPARIDFAQLQRIPSEHAVVSNVRATGGVNQHAYLARFLNQYWLMWSDGPGIEDRAGQRVKFAVSEDGLSWSEPAYLTPEPPISGPNSPTYNTRSAQGFRWMARGFWLRRGELLALASLDEAAGLFGPSLQLRAFRLDPKTDQWHEAGTVCNDAINNFPPQQLPSGIWMMSRCSHDCSATGLRFLLGGEEAIDKWETVPVPHSGQLALDEPFLWVLPDGNLMVLFRDNHKSGKLFRSFSANGGREWTQPVRTNFPDASSRFHGIRLSDGRYLLVSNADPAKREPLVLSLSSDGVVFNRMLWLAGERQVDGPFVLENQGTLLVAFSSEKQAVEILRIRLTDLDPAPNKPATSP